MPLAPAAALAVAALSAAGGAAEVPLGAVGDNSLYAESGNESDGVGNFFFASTNGFGDARRALIRFDVASAIPAGATITEVERTL